MPPRLPDAPGIAAPQQALAAKLTGAAEGGGPVGPVTEGSLESAQQPPLAPASTAAPAPASPSKSVRFIRTFRQYQRNDCCGFPAAYADQLIQKGVAVDAQQAFVNRAMVRK